MTFLPLIERELGVRARRRGSYWVRFAVGGAGVLICLPELLSSNASSATNTIGQTVFNSLVAVAFILCCAACLLTSDVIGAEQREGTLGLLFLTRVKWFDVVLGKLASNGIISLAALLTLLPLLMIPVLAGGVTGGEALRKGLALLGTLFLALTVGVYSSTCMQDRFKAARRAAGWLVLVVFLPPFFNVLLSSVTPFPTIGLLSPLMGVVLAGASEYLRSPASYWICLAITCALGGAFLIRAGGRLQRLVREDEPQAETPTDLQPSLPAAAKISSDLVPAGHSLRTRWSSLRHRVTPVEWLALRQRGLRTILWFGALIGIIYTLTFRLFMPWRTFGMNNMLWLIGTWVPQVLLGGLSAVFFAWAASRFFIEGRRNGELELLLTTPLGVNTIMSDQWKVLKRALRGPMLAILISFLLPFGFMMLSTVGFRRGATWLLPYSLNTAFNLVNVFFGIVALCWTGLWFGMKASGQAGAIMWTVGVVKGLPYLTSFLWSLLLAVANVRSSAAMGSAYLLVAYAPQIAILMFYVWIIRAAKRGVLGELSGAESHLLSFRKSMSIAKTDAAGAILKARNWRTT